MKKNNSPNQSPNQSPDQSPLMSVSQIERFYQKLANHNPSPKGELDYINHYTLLVAIVLSAQATDKGVNKATKPLFEKVKTPKQMVALGLDGLTDYIKTIGLFRTKAKNVIALSQIIMDEHQGQVPENRQALEALPGVGRKTANVLLNIAFGWPTIAVDTHIFRVANRTGLAPGKNVVEVEKALLERTPEKFLRLAHHWLILHGRYICQARKPLCMDCMLGDLCQFPKKNEVR